MKATDNAQSLQLRLDVLLEHSEAVHRRLPHMICKHRYERRETGLSCSVVGSHRFDCVHSELLLIDCKG